MSSPTQSAELSFTVAINNSSDAQAKLRGKDHIDGLVLMALAQQQTANGLRSLSVGVRATYMLLEKVERQLQQQKR